MAVDCSDSFFISLVYPYKSGIRLHGRTKHCMVDTRWRMSPSLIYEDGDPDKPRLILRGLSNIQVGAAADPVQPTRPGIGMAYPTWDIGADGNKKDRVAFRTLTFCDPCDPPCWVCSDGQRTQIRESPQTAESLTLEIIQHSGGTRENSLCCDRLLSGHSVALDACTGGAGTCTENECCDDLIDGYAGGDVIASWEGANEVLISEFPDCQIQGSSNDKDLFATVKVICYHDRTSYPYVCHYYLVVTFCHEAMCDGTNPRTGECCLVGSGYDAPCSEYWGCKELVDYDKICGAMSEQVTLFCGTDCDECAMTVEVTGVGS